MGEKEISNGGMPTLDSGERQVFETGCQRDTQAGKTRPDLAPPFALFRIFGVYERGAAKYDDNNWLKGMPYSRAYGSALRHLFKWKLRKALGMEMDEDHLAQAAWNIMTIMEYELIHPELDDMQDIYMKHTKQKPESLFEKIKKFLGNLLTS